MRVACWGLGLWLALAACAEPAVVAGTGAARADGEVALVAAVKGDVTIRDAQGGVRPATPEIRLRRSDTLVLGPGAEVVVLLANKYVLKIPDDQEVPVRSLAHIDDPPATKSVQQMFQDELGDGYAGLIDRDKMERIAGWNQLQSAGDTPAPEVKSEARMSEVKPTMPPKIGEQGLAEQEKKIEGHGAGAPPPITLDTKVSDAKTAERDPSQGRGKDSRPEPNRRQEPPESPSDPSAENAGDGPEVDDAVALPRAWTLEAKDGKRTDKTDLPQLLRDNWGALSQCLGGAKELRVVVEGGAVKAVTPAGCAAKLVGKALPEAGGAATVIVRL